MYIRICSLCDLFIESRERERERERGGGRDIGREGGKERERERERVRAEWRDFSEKNKVRQNPTSTEEIFTYHTDAVCLK